MKDIIIIGVVVFGAIALIGYLIIRNEKDKDQMKDIFNKTPKKDEDELNDDL